MQQDLAHKRPFLFVSLIFALTYPLTFFMNLPDLVIIVWKMGAVSCLALYALRNHSHGHFIILAISLAFYAFGDGLIQFDLIWGAIAFAIGHLVAIYLFSRYRRDKLSFSQKALALFIPLFFPFIGWSIIQMHGEEALGATLYLFIISVMAAVAWTSSFPRYRVGLGAIIFIISDLLILVRMGLSEDILWMNLAVWYSYYFGVFLMATGIVQTMRKKGT